LSPLLAPALPREILRLAAPTILVALAQSVAQTAEMWLVGRLGTEALAGYALVLPLLLLLQMMSAGAMGGGVASAVARALGAGQPTEASALVGHALVIAVLMGLAFTLPVLLAGAALFGAMGGRGAVLAHALDYAGWLFGAAVLVWLANTLAAVLRGTGNMAAPARILLVVWLVEVPLSALLMLGFGWGLAGAGIAYALVFLGACVALWRALRRGAAGFVPRLLVRPQAALFRRILGVGALASLMAFLANLTTVLLTAQVAAHGDAAIAAYGVGVRIEFLMVPLAFGIGSALTALVGRRVGAGGWAAARLTAWRGAALAGTMTVSIGALCAVFADPLAGLFSADPPVQAAIALYLTIVGPAFGAFGIGMALYFAAQGAGRLAWPFAGALARIGIAVGGGALLAPLYGLAGLFAAIAGGLLAYGLAVAQSVRPGVWR
jgi:putative MATE family efflux protein